jgi:hypothetical protein
MSRRNQKTDTTAQLVCMVGKEVTPKTISRHNQKIDLCNQKLFPAATKKDTTAQLVW